jgi:NAD(P)H-dependent FMN reductase
MSKLQIIIGSTRPGRAADRVTPWVIDRSRAHGGFDVEVLDLRDWPLPIFAEHWGSIGDFNDPTYSTAIVRNWNRKIKEADALPGHHPGVQPLGPRGAQERHRQRLRFLRLPQ